MLFEFDGINTKFNVKICRRVIVMLTYCPNEYGCILPKSLDSRKITINFVYFIYF